MQYTPYALRDAEWNESTRNALGDVVIKTLAQFAPGIESSIIERRIITPADMADRYSLPEGNLDYAELGLDQILFMRPAGELARYQTPIQNLHLCGADTHPGRALAGASGRLAARALLSK